MSAIKVRRSGIDRIFRKTPFRTWLDNQSRAGLTYDTQISDRDGKGWTLENFVRECWHRGFEARIGTAAKWQSGSEPRPSLLHELIKAFPGIKF